MKTIQFVSTHGACASLATALASRILSGFVEVIWHDDVVPDRRVSTLLAEIGLSFPERSDADRSDGIRPDILVLLGDVELVSSDLEPGDVLRWPVPDSPNLGSADELVEFRRIRDDLVHRLQLLARALS